MMRTARGWGLAIVAAIGTSAARPAAADMVVLKTGEVFYGQILRATSEEVYIKLESGGVLSFRANRVERINERGKEASLESAVQKGMGEGAPPRTDRQPPSSKDEATAAEAPGDPVFPVHASAGPDARSAQDRTAGKGIEPRQVQVDGSSLRLPPGFRCEPPGGASPAAGEARKGPALFRHKATGAEISAEWSSSSLEKARESLARLAAAHGGKVVREVRRSLPGSKGVTARTLTVAHDSKGIKEIHVLAEKGERVFRLTLRAADTDLPRLSMDFEECVDSLRIEEGAAIPGTEKAPERAPSSRPR
jgi:hypothetical protein